jgi:hypothetical protein
MERYEGEVERYAERVRIMEEERLRGRKGTIICLIGTGKCKARLWNASVKCL